MEVIILAGGFGTRLRSVVPDLPKPMASVAGRPFLEYILSDLSCKNVSRVIFSLGYQAEKISSYFGKRFNSIDLMYQVEDKPLGTGGAVKASLQKCETEYALILNGDTYLDLNLNEVNNRFISHRNNIIVGCSVDDTSRYGRILSSNGRINGFMEKGISGPGLINAGFYVLAKESLVSFEPLIQFSLEKDYFEPNVELIFFELFEANGSFIDIGIPEDYARAQLEFANFFGKNE